MPQFRPRPIALTRLHKACNRQQIPWPQPQMAPTHKGRTRIKARVKATDKDKTGKVRSRGKVRDKDRTRIKARVKILAPARAEEEEEIILTARQNTTKRSLCQGKLY